MTIQQNHSNSDDLSGVSAKENSAQTNRKPYEAPVLVSFGDVRDITLGPTVGIGESGNELGFRNPI